MKALNIDTGRATVTAHAICAVGAKLRYVVDTLPIAAGSGFGVSATTCGDDGFVTGGGAKPKAPLTVQDYRLTASVPGDVNLGNDMDNVPDDRLAFDAVNENPVTGATSTTTPPACCAAEQARTQGP